jgi:geranylgeranyl diphosphate synthase type II
MPEPAAERLPWYRAWAEQVDAYLDRVLPPEDADPAVLHEAMRYAVFGGGKRLRPVLVLASCEAAGGEAEAALPVAAAVELVHAYSLVHDDLPAMDDDDFRRGRPTVHRVYGEALAILAGDALLTRAFELLARELPGRCPTERVLAVMTELGRAAGSTALIAGQVEDLAAAVHPPDLAQLERIHLRKTGALFAFAARAGGMVAGADPLRLEALERFARSLGLAFQITDDVLDAVRDAAAGRFLPDRGGDPGRATYATLLDPEEARRRARRAVEQACAALAPLGERAARLRILAEFAAQRDH